MRIRTMYGEPRTFPAIGWPPVAVAAAFFPIHFLATALGNALLVAAPSSAAFWPAAGTLIAALLLFPRRHWPWLCAAGLAAELLAYTVQQAFVPPQAVLIGLVNVGQALLAAWLVGRYIGPRVDFARTAPTARLTLLLFIATFAGGLLGGLVVAGGDGLLAYWRNQQAWWLSAYLGAMVLVPLFLNWAQQGARSPHSEPAPKAWYVGLQFIVLATALWHVFSGRYFIDVIAFDSPFLIYAILLWFVASSGARRLTLALLLVVIAASGYTLAGHGPFSRAIAGPFGPVLELQAFLVLVVVPLLIVQASNAEKRNALRQLRASDQRYRAFVEHSSEAIFRLELAQPMPLLLSGTEQRKWLGKHAWVAEANDAYRKAEGGGLAAKGRISGYPPWLRHCLATIPDTLAVGGRIENVECVLPGPYGLDRTLLVSLTTDVAHGALQRIWGVARDVTHFRVAQRRLEEQQRELRALAAELTLSEQRARRKIAADLHDGLAQSLVGLQLHIKAIRMAAASSQPLPDLSELELTIAESTAQVRALMSDLMPPGLNERDIVAGLRWLADEFAQRQRTRVDFEDDGQPKPLAEENGILVFQAARQLLQNVARHARATVVTIRTAVRDGNFELTVSDTGVGFNVSDLTFLPTQQGGFGLYSIRERLIIIGGTLEIDSAPGRGTQVLVRAPLGNYADARRVSEC